MAAHSCPTTQNLSIPRLLDDLHGTADYLYRGDPFRLCVIDLDGNIAYHSADVEADHASTSLHATIGRTLDALLANGGRISRAMIAKGRSDAVGKPAAGLWLPRAEYFTVKPSPRAGEPTVEVVDARGYMTDVPKSAHAGLQRQRGLVARLFTPGSTSSKPVVLAFVNGTSLPAAAKLEAWYRQQRSRADFYLVYADAPGTPLPKRAQAALAWVKTARLTLPCLVDGPENDVTFAYGGAAPRLVMVSRQKNVWAVRYISTPGADGVTRGLPAAQQALAKLK